MFFQTWSDAEVEKVRQLAATGKSSATIAVLMNKTRNSIIGLCSRRGIKLTQRVYTKKMQKFWKKEKDYVASKDTGLREIKLINIKEDECRYIEGDARSLTCCGAPTFKSSYCPDHKAKIYYKV